MPDENIKYLEDYPLFFEELARDRSRTAEPTKKDRNQKRNASLSENDVAKLSDDLRRPMKDPATETDPLQ